MNLEEIQKTIITQRDLSPGTLAQLLVDLSAEYAHASLKLEEILLSKPEAWNEMRKDYKSDTATERAWSATEQGKMELHWHMTIKRIEKMMSGCKSMINVRSDEARNLY
jgi:hypothetical protein